MAISYSLREASPSTPAATPIPSPLENLNRAPPFGTKPSDRRALNDAEIDDIVAFLGTLTDADQLLVTIPAN